MSAVLRALEARAAAGDPIRVGLVGAGYAGRGFAARIIRRIPGIELVADREPDHRRGRARVSRGGRRRPATSIGGRARCRDPQPSPGHHGRSRPC